MRRVFVIAAAGSAAIAVFFYVVVPLFFSLPEGIGKETETAIVFTDRKGEPLRRLLNSEGLRTDPDVEFRELPDVLIEATLAAEDQRFFSHGGIDFRAVGRALWQAGTEKRFVSGASTISQQLIKLSSPPAKRNLVTKGVEMAKARKLEMFWGKDDILTAYFNRLPYGNQLVGCKSAARRYFAKPVGDLSLAESALLAAIPNRPGDLNPWRNFDAAKRRQEWILYQMLKAGSISDEQYRSALQEPIDLQTSRGNVYHAPHFLDLVQGEAEAGVSLFNEGAEIRTSLDLKLQQVIESQVASHLSRIDLTRGNLETGDLNAAVVVVENETGEVLALTGSRSYFDETSGQINGAWTPRSAGSTLKPFTYLLALEKGYTAASVLPDLPVEYAGPSGSFRPVNYDRKYRGPVSLRRALATSLNVPAVRLLNELGGPRVLHRLLRDELRLRNLAGDGGSYGLGLTIGNAEVRLLELTNAYACLARLGVWKPYRFYPLDPLGSKTQQGAIGGAQESETRRVFSPETCWIINDILSDNEARSAAFGVHSALRCSFRVAAKTGTSTDFRDSWAVGYTPQHTVGVWVGRFNNRPLPMHLTGAVGAGSIFHDIMEYLYERNTPQWYHRPDSIVERDVDEISGKLVNRSLESTPRKVNREVFSAASLPELALAGDYSIQGKTRLPIQYESWFLSESNGIGNWCEVKLEEVEAGEEGPKFEIVSPKDGTTIYLDSDLPFGGKRVQLRVEGIPKNGVRWSSDTLLVKKFGNRDWLILTPGSHRVKAVDVISGNSQVTQIVVEAL